MGWRFISFLTLVGCPLLGLAYPTPVDVDGSLHTWPITAATPDVFYEVVSEDQAWGGYLESIVDESANLWSSVDGSLLRIKPSSDVNSPQITVYYDSSIAGGDAVAGYSVFDGVDNGVPKHCSIHIAVGSSVDPENLNKTTLHELGHCLGLAHSLMPESIMSYNLERNSFSLSVDDRAAMARLYPADGHAERLAPGCSIGLAHPTTEQTSIFIGLLAFPVLAQAAGFLLRKAIWK